MQEAGGQKSEKQLPVAGSQFSEKSREDWKQYTGGHLLQFIMKGAMNCGSSDFEL